MLYLEIQETNINDIMMIYFLMQLDYFICISVSPDFSFSIVTSVVLCSLSAYNHSIKSIDSGIRENKKKLGGESLIR